jgi:hypothetical protein
MTSEPIRDDEVPPARRFRWPLVTWLALAALGVGAGLFWFGGSDQIETIRVRQVGLVIPNIMNSPDFYVALILHDGTRHDTASYKDTPIGGGLNFTLPEPVSLSEISQVVLYDDNWLEDDMLDRADVAGRKCDGQSYSFEMQGQESQAVFVGGVLMAMGGLGLAYVVIAFVRAHAL